jgi:hypothetical protein
MTRQMIEMNITLKRKELDDSISLPLFLIILNPPTGAVGYH